MVIDYNNFEVKFATIDDTSLILNFIKKLAIYEELENEVEATEEKIIESLFHNKEAEVLIGYYDNNPVGFMLFYHNYSTFLANSGIYLEDFFIDEEWRNKGLGKRMFEKLIKVAHERKCKRIDWSCLRWNEPSIQFYNKRGAKAQEDWIQFRLTDY